MIKDDGVKIHEKCQGNTGNEGLKNEKFFFSRSLNLRRKAAFLAITQSRFPVSSGVLLKKKGRPVTVGFASTSAGFASQDTSMRRAERQKVR